MRIVFVGSSKFGLSCLSACLEVPCLNVVGVVTAPQSFSISYRPEGMRNVLHADVASFAAVRGLPSQTLMRSMDEPGLLEAVKSWKPDAFLVAGWYHMIPRKWRELAPAYGLHASLLPDYSGGAPLVWAIINGETKTGITLFQMDDGVDSGPIAGQKEEPRVGQSYPNFYAAKLASKFVKVVLSGSGGDELFGGYPWRYYRAATSQNFEEYIDQYYMYWQRLANNSELKELFQPIWKDVSDVWTRDIFRDVFQNHDNELVFPEDYINHSLYFEAKTFLHGLFVVEDKLSMAHSLESRVPFMDNDLVDFAMKCPVGLKLNNLTEVLRINENEPGNKQGRYFQKTNDGKQILRDMMAKYIPKNIVQSEKQGFSAPDASWFKGESIDFVKRTLLNENARIYEVMDRNALAKLIEGHLRGERNRRLLIWSLLNVETWMRDSL